VNGRTNDDQRDLVYPYTPQTNSLAARFNGRVQREVLGITIYSHRDLETLLKGFNQAYNKRRQRVLTGQSPEEVCDGAWPPSPNSPTYTSSYPIHTLYPSLLMPRRFRIQTPSTVNLGYTLRRAEILL
jgi:hypothetical protein